MAGLGALIGVPPDVSAGDRPHDPAVHDEEAGMSIRLESSIDQLAAQVRGQVLAAPDERIAQEAFPFNAAVQHSPDVVVGATCTEDVQAAVRFAAAHGLRVSVQATGHGAVAPIEGGLLITTQRMQHLSIDPAGRTAVVGAGVKWRRVIDEGAEFGLAPLSGSSSDVGVVGYTLGGGLPVLGRTFGYASDYVLSIDIVTADGELRRVSPTDDPDLFWALRGGKPDVGIVTSMTIELVSVAEFYAGSIYFDGHHAPELLRAYAEWCRTVPDEMTSAIALMRLPNMPDVPEPLRERFTVQLRIAYIGDNGDELLRPLRDVAPSIIDYVGPMPYTEVDRVHNDPEHPLPLEYTTVVLDDLSPEAIDTLMSEAGPGVQTPILMVEIRHLGGALARPAPFADSVGLRQEGYCVFMLGVLMPEIAPIVPVAIAQTANALSAHATGSSFVNLHGRASSQEDRARPWSGEVYASLSNVKKSYDPDGRFQFAHWS
jgi:FAD/FMN-containing dehydrogenase